MKFERLIYLIKEQEYFDFYNSPEIIKDIPTMVELQNQLKQFLSFLDEDIDYLNDIESSAKSFVDDLYDGLSEHIKGQYIERLVNITWKYIDNNRHSFKYKENTSIFSLNNTLYFLEQDDETYEFASIDEDEISTDPEGYLDFHFPLFDIKDLYLCALEQTLGSLQDDPSGTYYHYTTEEAWEEIQEDGYMITSSGTGLENRGQSGIFTSVDPETYADGTYGDVCLKLDIEAYINDGHRATAEVESPVLEMEIANFINCVLDKECESYCSSDYSQFTVIIIPEEGSLPIKYITRIE